MRYETFQPCPALRGRVRYWRLTGEAAAGDCAFEPVLPDGCVELVVHLGDPFRIEEGSGARLQPRVLLAGPGTAPVRLAPGARFDVVGLHLEAAVAAPLLDAPMAELVDRLPALDEIAPRLARSLAEELASPRVGERWTEVLDRRLLATLASARAREIRVETMAARLRARRGRLAVSDLAQAFGLSTRQLERDFRRAIGFSPKLFARLVRFQSALGQLQSGRRSLGEVAAGVGYWDQAHMVRDFRHFAGSSPSHFLRGSHALADCFVDGAPARMTP